MRFQQLTCACCVIIVILLARASYPQTGTGDQVPPDDIQSALTAEEEKPATRSINVDIQAVYGQYNNMLSTVNFSQEQSDFVYLLRSYLKKSNDYGYKDEVFDNTSYYENRIGFTGNVSLSEKWETLFEIDVHNDSYGMGENPVYTREEKDNVGLELKNIVKHTPSYEMSYTVGGAQYYHRLNGQLAEDSTDSRLYQAHGALGGEYIWSSSSRLRYSSTVYYYDYSKTESETGSADNDYYMDNELVDDFNLTSNFGVTIGAMVDTNRDDVFIPNGQFGVSYKGFTNATIAAKYKYDMEPFRPEEFYLQQKYIQPVFDLPPGRVHHGHLRIDYRMNSTINVKMMGTVEHNKHFYNYFQQQPGDVLVAYCEETMSAGGEFTAVLHLVKNILDVEMGYTYMYYDAENNITYRPRQQYNGTIKFNGTNWKMSWDNRVLDEMYTNPETNDTIDSSVVGDLDFQLKMLEGFFANFRVENMYNNKYYLRENYPEPGITLLGGVRILL